MGEAPLRRPRASRRRRPSSRTPRSPNDAHEHRPSALDPIPPNRSSSADSPDREESPRTKLRVLSRLSLLLSVWAGRSEPWVGGGEAGVSNSWPSRDARPIRWTFGGAVSSEMGTAGGEAIVPSCVASRKGKEVEVVAGRLSVGSTSRRREARETSEREPTLVPQSTLPGSLPATRPPRSDLADGLDSSCSGSRYTSRCPWHDGSALWLGARAAGRTGGRLAARAHAAAVRPRPASRRPSSRPRPSTSHVAPPRAVDRPPAPSRRSRRLARTSSSSSSVVVQRHRRRPTSLLARRPANSRQRRRRPDLLCPSALGPSGPALAEPNDPSLGPPPVRRRPRHPQVDALLSRPPGRQRRRRPAQAELAQGGAQPDEHDRQLPQVCAQGRRRLLGPGPGRGGFYLAQACLDRMLCPRVGAHRSVPSTLCASPPRRTDKELTHRPTTLCPRRQPSIRTCCSWPPRSSSSPSCSTRPRRKT